MDMNYIMKRINCLTNNSVITELTATGSDKTRKYMTRLQEIPKYAGIYTDNLTFDISFETTNKI